MAMNPRLLRPLASGKNPETLDWINAVYAAGSSVNTATANAVDQFVSGCKSDGIWDAIKSCCVLCGPDTLAGALVPLVGSAPTNNNFVAGDYNRLTGLVGDGSTTYLDSNRNNNADPQDDKHLAVYKTSDIVIGNGSLIGTNTSANGSSWLFDSPVSNVDTVRINTNPSITSVQFQGTGFVGASRSASSTVTHRLAGSDVSAASTSQTPLNENIDVFRGANSQYIDARLAFYSIGEALDLEALDTRVTALITAIGNS